MFARHSPQPQRKNCTRIPNIDMILADTDLAPYVGTVGSMTTP